jgi:hypothetical protein
MTRVVMLFLLVSVSAGASAQSFDEWFRQKKTQLDYLRQQIAALEAYSTVTEVGYDIVQEGTGFITAIKKDDYALHSSYFDDLMNLRPAMGQYPGIQATMELGGRILSLSAETNKQAEVLPDWSEAVAVFFQGMLTDCLNDLDLLKKLTVGGQVQLTDGERLAAIDRLYRRMQDRYKAGVSVRGAVIFLRNNLMK